MPGQKHLLIDASGINFIDSVGADVLAVEAKRRQRLGGALYLYRVNADVLRTLTRSGRIDEIGTENVFPMQARAVGFIYEKLDSAICAECPRQIFRECKASLPDGTPRENSVRPEPVER
jgi:SulP family sulfate permease